MAEIHLKADFTGLVDKLIRQLVSAAQRDEALEKAVLDPKKLTDEVAAKSGLPAPSLAGLIPSLGLGLFGLAEQAFTSKAKETEAEMEDING